MDTIPQATNSKKSMLEFISDNLFAIIMIVAVIVIIYYYAKQKNGEPFVATYGRTRV